MYKCEYCGKEFDKPVTSGHKRKCPEFLASKLEADRIPPPCVCGHASTSLTQMKRHRPTCEAWLSRDKNSIVTLRIKATFERKYGVDNASLVPGAKEKKERVMIERYGAPNVFCRESSLYEKVQSHWDGKDRTAHLPKDNFARPEIKEKIRQVNLERYGVENPSQNPEIRAKQLATNLERYGDEQPLRTDVIRRKGRETSLIKYGVSDPAQSEKVKEKARQTNLERYGVEWTGLNSEVRAKRFATELNKYGSLYSKSALNAIRSKEAWPSTYEKMKKTNIERYGVDNHMKNPDLAAKALTHSRRAGPNQLECMFNKLFPFFCFSGDGSFWKKIPSTNKNKNPDFCFPVKAKQNGFPSFGSVTHVVEIFGDYWHGEERTGIPNETHEQNTINEWGEVGLKCLVVWESDLYKDDYSELDARIEKFLKP
jgi:hypothetical protein